MISSVIKWKADSNGKIIELDPPGIKFFHLPSIPAQEFNDRIKIEGNWYRLLGSLVEHGYAGVLLNINEEMMELNSALARIQQQQLAFKVTQVAYWDVEFTGNKTNYLHDPANIYGMNVDLLPSIFDFMDIVHPDDKEMVKETLFKAAVPDGNYDSEFRILCPDGSIKWLLGKGKTLEGPNGLHIVGVNIDITERKNSELKVKDLQNQLAATFNQAAVGIAHVSPEGKLLRVNAKFAEFTGYTQDELLLKTFQDITHPDDLQIDLDLVHQVLDNKISNYSLEKRYIRKNGSIIWVNLSVALVRQLDGQPNYFISVIEDISEIKEDQLAIKELTTELEFRVKERTKELEDMNSELEHILNMISQNIKDPVLKIKNNLELIQEKIKHLINSSIKKHFDEVLSSSTSLNQMAQNLLGLSRVKRGELIFSIVNVKEAFQTAVLNISEQTHDKINYSVSELGDVYGNKTLICQLFQNLIKNSQTQRRDVRELSIEVGAINKDGQKVYYFKDNTEGVPSSDIQRIFMLTSANDNEQQFNLFLCKSIIKRHKGNIWVESDSTGRNIIYFNFGLEA